MDNLKKNFGTFIRTKNTTSDIMRNLIIALLPIIIFAFYINGVVPYINNKIDFIDMFYPLLFIVIGALTSIFIETIYSVIILKKKTKLEILDYMNFSYGLLPGLFLSLVLPINTPIYVLIIGVIFGVVVGKLIFGGFGNNIFNPALLGYLFIFLCFSSLISSGYTTNYTLDATTSATPLTNMYVNEYVGDYETLVEPYGGLLNLFVGIKPGTLGEVSSLLIIISFIYLTVKKVIKPNIPIFYIGTVFIMTTIIALITGMGMWFPIFNIVTGGLLFGAVFMATDPVTSPLTKTSAAIYGICLGVLTVIIRFFNTTPEGVMISILIMNMFVVNIDRLGAVIRFDKLKYILTFVVSIILVISLSIITGFSIKKEETTTIEDNNIIGEYEILEKNVEGDITTYIVTQRGYVSDLKIQIELSSEGLVNYEVLEQAESYYSKVKSTDFIETIKANYENIESVDVVSGATYTSQALIDVLINTKNDYIKGE